MIRRFARRGLLAAALLVLLVPAKTSYAQETTLSGTVTDATDAVLPGVTVTATHVETGNTFVGVSDASGNYRIGGLRTGIFRVTAELAGFATVLREAVELLVGQRAVVDLRMVLSTVQETVTVSGAAPLVDVTQSKLGGNVDTRQMQDLPLNGRDWLGLTALAPGSRVNSVSGASPAGPDSTPAGTTAGYSYQLNLDGQQVSNNIAQARYGGQAKFSRDAIGEFEFISSRFDATQGRSGGLQVNAVTKAGTNQFGGTLSGYFRDDNFNEADFVAKRVLPYSNQQVSGTFGGPIKRDQAHFFVYYEGEREPSTYNFNSPYPRFNRAISSERTENIAGLRFDQQFSSQTRLMVRANGRDFYVPNEPLYVNSLTTHPSRSAYVEQTGGQLFASLTHTFSPRALNDIKVGFNYLRSVDAASIPAAPNINLIGYSIGPLWTGKWLYLIQRTVSVRNDFTYVRSRHELKVGGEFLRHLTFLDFPSNQHGTIDATLGPVPGNIEDLFPVWNDPSTWNLAALSPITRRYTQSFPSPAGRCVNSLCGNYTIRNPQQNMAAWVQDNWSVSSRLTLNLGLRYDIYDGALGENIDRPPFMFRHGHDTNNVAPRLGFNYRLTDDTVLRGGSGVYYFGVTDQPAHHVLLGMNSVSLTVENDGRPNFAADPFNGRVPTYEEARASVTSQSAGSLVDPTAVTPFSYQTAIGFQQQLGPDMSFQADYVWAAGRHEQRNRDINISYNPVTGANFPRRDASKRIYREWTTSSMKEFKGESNYHALETAFTKRFGDGWQASATYTLSAKWDSDPAPINSFAGCTYPMNGLTMTCNTPLQLAPDLDRQYSLAVGDQRHRAVFNGIWSLPYRFQLSGLYFFGSGLRYSTNYGTDLRDGGSGRLRRDGTIVPRNNLVGKPLHRVDLRIQRRFPLLGRAGIDGIFEVFNLFNHANYGSYATAELSPVYGQPSQNSELAYAPRMLQLGFRLAF